MGRACGQDDDIAGHQQTWGLCVEGQPGVARGDRVDNGIPVTEPLDTPVAARCDACAGAPRTPDTSSTSERTSMPSTYGQVHDKPIGGPRLVLSDIIVDLVRIDPATHCF